MTALELATILGTRTTAEVDRDFDEYELETEEAGPSYQVVLRWAF